MTSPILCFVRPRQLFQQVESVPELDIPDCKFGDDDTVLVEGRLHEMAERVVVLEILDRRETSDPTVTKWLSREIDRGTHSRGDDSLLERFEVQFVNVLKPRVRRNDEWKLLEISQTMTEPRWKLSSQLGNQGPRIVRCVASRD